MIKWLNGFLDRCFVLCGALFLAQAPLFMQQYKQQLAARVAELKLQVDSMNLSAKVSNKTIGQLIQKFTENPDGDIARQGEVMQALLTRWQNLQEALLSIQDSSIWSRPFAFLYHSDTEIFSNTFHHFTMGLPLNLEGSVYALIGAGIGYLSFACLKFLGRMLFGQRKEDGRLTFKNKIHKADNQISSPK